jgi:hypothetical protein
MRLRILVLAVALAAPRMAHADEPKAEQAKHAFEEGVDLEKRSDYASALAKFRAAEQIKPTAGVRFHIAYCLEMLGSVASAAEAYESTERIAREQGKPDVESAAHARLEPLRARVPELTITAPANARIDLDGTAVLAGSTKRIDPGEHTVSAQAEGYERFARRLTIGEGTKQTVDVVLVRITNGPPPETTSYPPEAPKKPNRTLAIATTAGAVALVAVGITTFLVAGSTADDARRDCPAKPSCDSERSQVRLLDTIALAGFASGLVLGGFSVYLWTSSQSSTVALRGEF